MKRIVALALVGVIGLALTSCAPKADSTSSPSSPTSGGKSVSTEVYSTTSDVEQCALFEKAIAPFYEQVGERATSHVAQHGVEDAATGVHGS